MNWEDWILKVELRGGPGRYRVGAQENALERWPAKPFALARYLRTLGTPGWYLGHHLLSCEQNQPVG